MDLEAIQSDYKAALTRADAIMAEGKAIVEDAQALATCEEPTASTEDLGSLAREQIDPETAAPLQGTAEGQDEQGAAEAARAISGLEATGDFSALYDRMHPDAKTIVPREVVVGWFGGYFAGKETTGITVTGVHFVSWTWSVTGVTYSHTAGIFFVQPIRVNGEYTEIEDVVRLVQDDTGEWRWFFGCSTEFVNEQIDKYAP